MSVCGRHGCKAEDEERMSIMADEAVKATNEQGGQNLHIGIDVGSTTVKLAILDNAHNVRYSIYQRHHADVRATIVEVLEKAAEEFGDEVMTIAITGSGGLLLAQWLGIEFVQEVIASKTAVETFIPKTDVAIELGGEDAKIIYFDQGIEQRMNGTCAGGTGAFIDQMAALLDTDAGGLNELAKSHTTIYPIASRCGVFAKTDVQPLLNEGARKEDIAASIFQSVVTQTISGLACGRPIRGYVAFLGGPLQYLPELRKRFYETLNLDEEHRIVPQNAHLFVAGGCAIAGAASETVKAELLSDVLERLKNLGDIQGSEVVRLPPLFADQAELDEFNARHAGERVPRGDLASYRGTAFLGIDAGSTTIKATLVNDDREIVWSSYATNDGSPLTAAIEIVKRIQSELPSDAWIARSCATGYGEGLITTGLHLDEGVVETMAHYRGAEMVSPGVTAVIDIGGQDMKYLAVTDGVIDSIAVNEACSSGCGSFLQTFARSMGLTIEEFTQAALASEHPVDLGSRCTVFMNSSVKQAQKEGASIEDIAAGLCYSVVRNALYKVIKLRDSGELGSTVVVQGGTFLNDAVLRAFELLTEREVTRPNIAGLMGAYGAALTARMHYDDIADDTDGDTDAAGVHVACIDGVDHTVSSILHGTALDELSMTTERDVCKLCQNHCKLTITTFHDGSRYVTGNRCERGGDAKRKRSDRPNLYDFKYKRAFAYRRLTDKKATRGEIGIPRVLNMYENYPFWFTLLTSLGFKVVISGRSNHELFETGIESIASENICYPAKLVHGHIKWLLNKGIRTIFYPCVSFEDDLVPESDNHYNCPVVANYPVVIEANMPELRADGIRFMRPYFNLSKHSLMVDRIVEEFAWAGVTREEAEAAVAAAYAEDTVFKHDVQQEGVRALAYMKEHNCRGIVLAGRPYHVDPEVNHGIPETICSLGMVVLSEDSVSWLDPNDVPALTAYLAEDETDPAAHTSEGFRHVNDRKLTTMPLRVMNQWAYHARLYRAAQFVASWPGLELVQLNSFGCGLDAVTTDQVSEILADKADVYTMLKIDEVSNLGAAKIRLRSLKAAVEERERNAQRAATPAASAGTFRHTGTAAPTPGRQILLDAVMGRQAGGAQQNRQSATMSAYANRVPFGKDMRRDYTIVAPQMSPIHFRLVEAAIRASGYKFDVLEHASKTDVETGLKYVNNDACYPAIMTVGQLVEAIKSRRYDPDSTALAISQTGGMCRATNYFALIRKALVDAGYPQIPVIAISTQGFVDNPGFTPTVPLLHRAAKSLIIGDLLMKCLYRVRPYEANPGSANRLYERWNVIVRETLLNHGMSKTAKMLYGRAYWPYAKLVAKIVESFDALPLRDVERKVRVGVVGEILVKYQPDANNHVVEVIESQDCEAVVPGIIDFMTMRPYINDWNEHNLGTGRNKALYTAFKGVIHTYMKPVNDALESSGGKFEKDLPMDQLVAKAQTVTSIGVQAGEGWLLTGEIVELIESGCPNIICAQPFACLPNHVTGRGMFGKIRRLYPQANIVSIDYDPGASEANQLNRIKLMIAAAKKNAAAGRSSV